MRRKASARGLASIYVLTSLPESAIRNRMLGLGHLVVEDSDLPTVKAFSRIAWAPLLAAPALMLLGDTAWERVGLALLCMVPTYSTALSLMARGLLRPLHPSETPNIAVVRSRLPYWMWRFPSLVYGVMIMIAVLSGFGGG